MSKKDEKEVNLITKDKIDGVKDDVFIHLADEITSIRETKTMYIPSTQNEAAMHLLKEIFNNSLDEANNANSTGKKIYVEFYQSECKFIVTDEGRGIPVDILADAVMKKHVSTKFVNLSSSRNKRLTGLHGVGLTVTAALTDYMSLTTYRGDHQKTIEIIDGELKEGKVKPTKKPKHGLSTVFIPSEKYLGALSITNDMVEEFIRRMSYIMPEDITVYFTYEEDPKSGKLNTVKYKALGLAANLEYLSTNMEFNPINIKYESEMFDLMVAFSYDKTLDEMLIESYSNYVITSESGTHELAAQRAICEYFSKEAKRLDPTSKYEVSYDDCKKGLVLVVNLEHCKPEFEGQHKSKVSNKDVLTEGKKGLIESLNEYFSKNPNGLKRVVTYLRQISKIRQEANKIKGVSNKKPSNFIDDAAIKGFYPVTDRKYNGYTELYLGEGDSAVSALLSARNAKHQALLGTMGVVDNVWDISLTQLLTKPIFKNLIHILGCGVGKDFDITKLRYNKIILAFDADVDGSNITSLFLCFFVTFLPELILQGKVYRAVPPLYLLEKKSLKRFYNGNEWLYDKKEYYNLYNAIISNNTVIALESSDKKHVATLKKKDAMDWLSMNSEYKLELDNLGKKAACDITILEYVTYYKILSDGNEIKFKKMIEKEFPEMVYDISNSALIGSYNGSYISLICDRLFMKSAKRFIREIEHNESIFIHIKNKSDESDLFKRMTIGQFYDEMYTRYNISIEQRYKGLGESDTDLLFSTVMNPKMRKLYRFTINDMDSCKEVLEMLHGKTDKMREKRRELLDNAQISYADIDN